MSVVGANHDGELISAADGGSEFFRGLPSFRFQGVMHFFKQGLDDLLAQNEEPVDALVVEGVPAHQRNRIMYEAECRSRKMRASLYLAREKLLLITVPILKHDGVAEGLADTISSVCQQLRLEPPYLNNVGKTSHVQRASNGEVLSEGTSDGGFRPAKVRPRDDDYPTVVIETGISQTWQALRAKGAWWFKASDFAVKMVLLVKMEPGKSVRIEKWRAITRRLRLGAMALKRAGDADDDDDDDDASVLEPALNQAVTIHAPQGMADSDPDRYAPASYRVTSRLRLEFFDVALREPFFDTTDIILSTAVLQQYASNLKL